MRINHNISALNANNQLNKTGKALDKSLERLSSGYRINRAADDAAGMAISQKMKTQIAGLDQASRNAADGISVIQTAEGALTEVGSMLQRMRELSVQAANGTVTPQDAKSIQAEIDQLNEEIQRISDTTEFNTKTLLNGNIDKKSYSDTSTVSLVSISDSVSNATYKITVDQDARQAVLVGTQVNVNATIPAGKINLNGVEIKVSAGDTVADVYQKLRDAGDTMNISVITKSESQTKPNVNPIDTAGYTGVALKDAGGTDIVFVSKGFGSDNKIDLVCDNAAIASALGISASATAVGVDAKASLTSGFRATATVSIKGQQITVSDSESFEMTFEAKPGTRGTVFKDATPSSTTGTPTEPRTNPSDPTSVIPAKATKITVLDAGSTP